MNPFQQYEPDGPDWTSYIDYFSDYLSRPKALVGLIFVGVGLSIPRSSMHEDYGDVNVAINRLSELYAEEHGLGKTERNVLTLRLAAMADRHFPSD